MAARTEQALGSVIEIKLPERHAALFPLCFSEIGRIEEAYSRFRDSSELSRLNRRLGVWQSASDELLMLAERAEEFRQKTDGYFDITLKARLEQLGYGPQQNSGKMAQQPSKIAQQTGPPAVLHDSGSAVKVDRKSGRIWLGKEIEFGGLGKGYVLDRVAALLEKNGVKHYFINAGGDVYARRGKGEEPWIVLLEHPDDPSRAIGSMELDGHALAGSAPNRRRWGAIGGPGERHHLLNPKTGEPVKGVKAVFVLARTGMEADAYAKGIFCGGFTNGVQMAGRLPVQALLISGENKMFQTPEFPVTWLG